MIHHARYFESAVDAAIAKEHFPAEARPFYTGLFGHAATWFERYSALLSNMTDIPVFQSGKMLSDFTFPKNLAGNFHTSLRDLLTILSSYQSGLNASAILEQAESSLEKLEQPIRALASRQSEELCASAQGLILDPESFIFILANWIKPYGAALRAHKEKDQVISEAPGDSAYCPFCGYYAGVSKSCQ